MAMDARTAQQRAIAKALAMGGAGAVERLRYGTYVVQSRTREQLAHTVSVDTRGTYHCTCEAALAGRPACWHRAAVYVAKVEAKGARVTGPAREAAPLGEALGSNVVPFARRAA